ncbi:MAG: TonB-dependent receptor domain-containing protein, partial [Pseudoalteromonas sp.]
NSWPSNLRNCTYYPNLGGVVYDFNDQYSVYASFTDVFNFGGQRDINAELLGPAFGENKEIGLRSSFINNALSIDFNVFQIDMNNVPTWTDQSLVYKAVKGMTSEGYELEVSGYITEDLSIMASYTNFNVSDAEGGIVADEMFKINANYQLSNDLNLAVSVNRTGEHQGYLRDSNNAFYFVPLDAYTLVNLTATYNVTDALTVQANIENATDEEYYSKVSGYTKRYGEPRNYSLRVMYNF